MVTALLATGMAPIAYGFSPQTAVDYKVDVVFDGFLPILGGNEGKAEVGMSVKVAGLSADGANLRASNEMTAFKISFNGAPLPLTLESAVEYFPKTTVSVTPQGKIVKSDAPNRTLPVKLPGLDVKRFPDITYLPIELPAGEIANGTTWEFKKSFGDADMDYTCTVKSLDDKTVTIGVVVKQEYSVLENDSLEVVKDRSDAVSEVKTILNGTGTVVFDRVQGLVRSVAMSNRSISTGENFVDKKSINRTLDSTLKVALVSAEPAKTSSAAPAAQRSKVSPNPVGDFFSSAVKRGQELWTTGASYLALLQFGLKVALGSVPGLSGLLKWLPGGGQ